MNGVIEMLASQTRFIIASVENAEIQSTKFNYMKNFLMEIVVVLFSEMLVTVTLISLLFSLSTLVKF